MYMYSVDIRQTLRMYIVHHERCKYMYVHVHQQVKKLKHEKEYMHRDSSVKKQGAGYNCMAVSRWSKDKQKK